MKKFELKIKLGKSVIFHKIFKFSESERLEYIKKIITEHTPHDMLREEIENVLIRTLGKKYWIKEHSADGPNCLYKMKIEDIAKKYPDILIVSAIQAKCYDNFSISLDDTFFCKSEEILINKTEAYDFYCTIVD